MHKRIWITRTLPGAIHSAAAFENIGFETIIAPLIEIVPANIMPAPPSRGAVLLFTSSNAVRVFAELTDHRNWKVLTVGDATARAAKKIGFTDVISAGGNWTDLAGLTKHAVPKGTELVHLCGNLWRGAACRNFVGCGLCGIAIDLVSKPSRHRITSD